MTAIIAAAIAFLFGLLIGANIALQWVRNQIRRTIQGYRL